MPKLRWSVYTISQSFIIKGDKEQDIKDFSLQGILNMNAIKPKPFKNNPDFWEMLDISMKFSAELISFLFHLAIFTQLYIHSPKDECTTDTALCFPLKPHNRSNLNIPL